MTDPILPPEPQPTAAPVYVAPIKTTNGPGIGALIAGIVAFLFAIIPVISFIAWLPALVAIILGIVGLVLKNRKRATAVIGLVLGILAVIIGAIVSLVVIAGAANSVNESIKKDDAKAKEPISLVYEITARGSNRASVTYDSFTTAGKDVSEQDTNARTPFKKTFSIERGGKFDFSSFSILAQGGASTKSITCTITLDGKVLATNTSKGRYSVATCTGTSSDLDD